MLLVYLLWLHWHVGFNPRHSEQKTGCSCAPCLKNTSTCKTTKQKFQHWHHSLWYHMKYRHITLSSVMMTVTCRHISAAVSWRQYCYEVISSVYRNTRVKYAVSVQCNNTVRRLHSDMSLCLWMAWYLVTATVVVAKYMHRKTAQSWSIIVHALCNWYT